MYGFDFSDCCIEGEFNNSCAISEFIAEVLEFDEESDEMDCINTAGSIKYDLLNIIKDFAITDVCSNSHSPNELLHNAITDACNNGGIDNIYDIFDELDSEDKIFITPNLKTLCPMYDCILNEMIFGPLGTTFVCDLLSSFDDDNEQDIIIRPGDFKVLGYDTTAVAATVVEGGFITIKINTMLSGNTDARSAFETLQHEFIHADIKRRLFQEYNWDGSNQTFSQAFFRLVYEEYGANASFSEHELMARFYVNTMVASLIEMNNGVGQFDDFVGLVYFGIPENVLYYLNISLSEALDMYDDYVDFISTPGNINIAFSNCD